MSKPRLKKSRAKAVIEVRDLWELLLSSHNDLDNADENDSYFKKMVRIWKRAHIAIAKAEGRSK